MDDCIFCKIAQGQIPALKIYEDGKFMAFLDVNPRARGHTIVIPKQHAETMLKLSESDIGSLFGLVQKTANWLVSSLGARGFNIGANNGQIAGQAVPHLHIHILPRFESDKHHAGFEAAFQVDENLKKDLENILRQVKSHVVAPKKAEAGDVKKGEEPGKDEKGEKHKWSFQDGELDPAQY